MKSYWKPLALSGQRLGLVVVGLVVAAGCDGGGSQPRDGGRDATSDARTGGRSGDAATGGATGTATGGAIGTGGGLGTGGGEGGAVGSGGAGTGTGGSSASGGATATGGAPATGGRALGGAGEHVSTGGASGIGGIPSTGGRPATGGASSSGGAPGSGGASGGAPGTGGANTGGAATGGAATGGAATGGANTGGANTGGANTGGANTGGAATGGRGTGGAGTGGNGGTAGSTSMYVVAHPDDDFLFQNPDIENDIRAGKRVRTVYVTSGDANNQDWQGREVGVLEADAAMANDSDPSVNDWSCAMNNYAGKPARVCTMTAHPLVSVVFLRLHDGQVDRLLSGTAVGTAGSTVTFNASELTATLSAILAETQPNWVGTLDGSLAHGGDHPDHITSAFFAFDVARLDGAARTPVMYRAYSIWGTGNEPADEPRNLTAAQHTEKARIMGVYQGGPIAVNEDYDQWCWRHYPIYPRVSANAPLRNGNLCLEPTAAADGSPVHLAACTGAANQNWTAGANNRIVHSGGRCLGLNGTAAVIETCSGSARDQIWTLLADGQIHGTVDQCLTTSGANVSSAVCEADDSQPTSFYFPPSYQSWDL